MSPRTGRYDIEKATPHDAPGLAAFLHVAWEEAGPEGLGFAGATDEMVAELADLGSLTSILEDRDTGVWIARRAGTVVAFAAAEAPAGPAAELSGIVVHRMHRSRGLGGELADRAIAWAAGRGAGHVFVRTEPHNDTAIGFYESHGFARVGLAEERVGGELLTVLELRKELGHDGGEDA